jgi:hypothetical protein
MKGTVKLFYFYPFLDHSNIKYKRTEPWSSICEVEKSPKKKKTTKQFALVSATCVHYLVVVQERKSP